MVKELENVLNYASINDADGNILHEAPKKSTLGAGARTEKVLQIIKSNTTNVFTIKSYSRTHLENTFTLKE